MRTRLTSTVVALCVLVLCLWTRIGRAAPEAHLLRIDPRASQQEGAPLLTTVIELEQPKKVGDAVRDCAALKGDAQTDCQSERLEQPQALYSPITFPDQAAILTVEIDGADRLATLVSRSRWGDSLSQPGVGTAWLVLIDAAGSMGPRFEDAKEIATAFVNSVAGNDIVDVVFFNDRQVVSDSKWQPASAKTQVAGFVNALKSTYPTQGRTRPLFNVIKQAATDSFKELGNVGSKVQVPLHQAMVVLSNGAAGADAASVGPTTIALNQYLTKGRFPEDNTVQPKMPVPVISVWLPLKTWDEARESAQQFMEGLANPEIGGFYDVVRQGQGAGKGSKIVSAVRARFNQMNLVKWRLSCIASSVTQSFKLVFSNTATAIAGDSTFDKVPIGIDPTTWPLDINGDTTKKMSDQTPVEPGGKFTIYGNFCWGGEKDRAEVYFVPTGQPLPSAFSGSDLQAAQKTQQQFIANGMRGLAVQSSDSDVTFTAPDKDSILWGSGSQAVVRLVVYDNKAHRTSGATAATVLTLKGASKATPWLYIVGGAFGAVVLILLVLVLVRGGGGGRRRGNAPAPAPVVAGGVAYVPGGPGPYAPPGAAPYGQPGAAPYGQPGAAPYAPPGAAPYGQPGPYAAPQADPGGAQPAPSPYYAASPLVPSPFAPAPAAASPYGATSAVAVPPQPDAFPPAAPAAYAPAPADPYAAAAPPAYAPAPADPYAAAAPAPSGRVVLSGSAGAYTVAQGFEMLVGRDGARCQIVLSEPRVSGVHARVKVENGQLFVQDEQSNNGTFVDGQRLAAFTWTPAAAGLVVRFGPVEFSVRPE